MVLAPRKGLLFRETAMAKVSHPAAELKRGARDAMAANWQSRLRAGVGFRRPGRRVRESRAWAL